MFEEITDNLTVSATLIMRRRLTLTRILSSRYINRILPLYSNAITNPLRFHADEDTRWQCTSIVFMTAWLEGSNVFPQLNVSDHSQRWSFIFADTLDKGRVPQGLLDWRDTKLESGIYFVRNEVNEWALWSKSAVAIAPLTTWPWTKGNYSSDRFYASVVSSFSSYGIGQCLNPFSGRSSCSCETTMVAIISATGAI